MELILWRHAEADDQKPTGSDQDRALTPRGTKHAKRMAGWLNHHCPASMRVLVSPAIRCQQTADALGRSYATVNEIGTDGSLAQLLDAARWPDADGATVLIVGHQPTIGLCIAALLQAPLEAIAVPKGAVWWLSNRQREESAQIVVRAVVTPRLL
jgi:phosphohistidine phosphatase